MTRSKKSNRPVLEVEDAHILIRIINRFIEAFDAMELSTEEALLIHILLDHADNAIWREFSEELMVVYERMLLSPKEDDDDTEPNDGSDDSTRH